MDSLGLYVDVENLQDVAKEAIADTFERWPDDFPRPRLLHLYVKADNAGVWRLWAIHAFPGLEIKVSGVQHYSTDSSKNSADIALALDAFADLLKGRTSGIAILSDDSDFAILFGKIEQEIPKPVNGKLPFIWFQTDRRQTRSSMLNEFLPSHYVRTVICAKQKTATVKTKPLPLQKATLAKAKPTVHQTAASAKPKAASQQNTVATKTKSSARPKTAIAKTKLPSQTEAEQGLNVSLAKTIIRSVQVGFFGHSDCMKLIKQDFPEHSFSKMNSVNFGTHFVNTLWPILEAYGVRIPNPNRSPRRYEMTAEAKQKARPF